LTRIGTLFNFHSVVQRAGDSIAGNLDPLSTLCRQKQLQFTWLFFMDRYGDVRDTKNGVLYMLSG